MQRIARLNICLALFLSIGSLAMSTDYGLSQVGTPTATRPAQHSTGERNDFAVLAKAVGPVVVNISTTQIMKRSTQPSPFGDSDPSEDPWERFFGQPLPKGPFRQQGLGSGFIIEPDGIILTNNHVVANAEKITVKLQDEREFEGRVIGKDPQTDIAVVKINVNDLPVVAL